MTKILVTGATGFLGRHVMPVFQSVYGESHVVGLSSRDFDLLKPAGKREMTGPEFLAGHPLS